MTPATPLLVGLLLFCAAIAFINDYRAEQQHRSLHRAIKTRSAGEKRHA